MMSVFLLVKAWFSSYLEMYLSVPVLSWGRAGLVKTPPGSPSLPPVSSRHQAPAHWSQPPSPRPSYRIEVTNVGSKASHHGYIQDGHSGITVSQVPGWGRERGVESQAGSALGFSACTRGSDEGLRLLVPTQQHRGMLDLGKHYPQGNKGKVS